MSNEAIFFITAVGMLGSVLFSFMFGRRWLYAAIAINLISIGVFGAKLIPLFGSVTNVGNVFYAAVFFAGQLLVEHYGKNEAKKSVWFGLFAVALFMLAGQFTIQYTAIPEAAGAAEILTTLFTFTPRLAVASLLAYLLSQSLNIRLYSYIRKKWERRIWIRSITASVAGQFSDSIIFFSVAFGGILPADILINSMVVGFAVKILVGFLGVPLLYASYHMRTRRGILAEEGETILSGIGEGLVMTDKDGKIVMANKASKEMLGWEDYEVIGKPIMQVLPLEDEAGGKVPPEERIITHVLSGKKATTEMMHHTYLVRKNGTRFPARIVVVPVLIDGRIMGAVEFFHDLTGEKEIEKLRADFLLLASHQLRTPLSGTRWLTETLQSGILGKVNKKQKEYLNDLYKTNNRMIELVSSMLDILRLEGGGRQIRKEQFPIGKLYLEISSLMEAAARTRKISLMVPSGGSASVTAETDFQIVKNILESFVANAINYSNVGKKVTLGARISGDELILFVKDEGIGIPKDEQKRIFERFYRASNAKLMKPDGTGLGLSISLMLAEKIGAKITFESEENKGSIFSLHIPKRARIK